MYYRKLNTYPLLTWDNYISLDINGKPERHQLKDWYSINPCEVFGAIQRHEINVIGAVRYSFMSRCGREELEKERAHSSEPFFV